MRSSIAHPEPIVVKSIFETTNSHQFIFEGEYFTLTFTDYLIDEPKVLSDIPIFALHNCVPGKKVYIYAKRNDKQVQDEIEVAIDIDDTVIKAMKAFFDIPKECSFYHAVYEIQLENPNQLLPSTNRIYFDSNDIHRCVMKAIIPEKNYSIDVITSMNKDSALLYLLKQETRDNAAMWKAELNLKGTSLALSFFNRVTDSRTEEGTGNAIGCKYKTLENNTFCLMVFEAYVPTLADIKLILSSITPEVLSGLISVIPETPETIEALFKPDGWYTYKEKQNG